MPELPEVETVRRDLARVLRGKKITRVIVSLPKVVRLAGGTRARSAAGFIRRLSGFKVSGVRRRGKLLIFDFADTGAHLLVHLKMTGQLIYRDGRRTIAGGHGWPLIGELPGRYTHAVITFSDSSQLFFNDLRQFGFLQLVDDGQLQRVLALFGPEPLPASFLPAQLGRALRGRRTSLKNVLLNQTLIAGLGNIYVDEACFRARLRPTRRADRVTGPETQRLYRAIRQVLREAIRARGTTFGSFRDGLGGEGNFVRHLKVYGRAGEPCRRCRTTLRRVTVGGRGTVYCPACQPR
jgi:formamidopyrimidine-DNA glycosylase